ncbi:MAG: signal peptidase I [Tissierellia bacterium]|nr:signal peptidase I [Tissierellia bacterium]
MKEYGSNGEDSIIYWIKSLALYIGIALLVRFFIFNITLVDGISMNPTLADGDRLITEKISLYFNEPKKGDIVVINAPDNSKDHYIKRLIGLPGDKIDLIEGKLYINDIVQEEDYINSSETLPYTYDTSWIVPEGEIFVMGDNRNHSNDSRTFGTIAMDQVIGISIFRVYPFNRMGKLN